MAQRTIARITAQEILDSRGEPTIRATVVLDDGQSASASVPAGASTGSHEARELRDGGRRYGGLGVLMAVKNVATVINDALRGMNVDAQEDIDRRLVELDRTDDRSHLGANAILSVSLACARTAAVAAHRPLYRYLRERFRLPRPDRFPQPMCNVLNGGRHADNNLSFQEYLLLPRGESFTSQLERTSMVIRRLREMLLEQGEPVLVADEGGFAPRAKTNEEPFDLLARAVNDCGLRLGEDMEFGLDAAASEFLGADGVYHVRPEGLDLEAGQLIDFYDDLVHRYPLRTLEDGLGEDDWSNWTKLTARLGQRLLVIGDDLFVTQKARLSEGIRARAANAILIKPNQVGTLTETMETIASARDDGYAYVISHRSGETSDDFIADLAVAVGSPFLKAGSLNRGERLEKYNRLLTIASEVGA